MTKHLVKKRQNYSIAPLACSFKCATRHAPPILPGPPHLLPLAWPRARFQPPTKFGSRLPRPVPCICQVARFLFFHFCSGLCCSICVRLRQVAAATEAAWMAKLMLSPKRALLHVQSAVKHVTGAGSAVKGVARALCECQHRRGACWQALAGSVVDVDRCVGVGTRVRRSCTRTRCVELVGASVSGRRVAGGWRASARAIWRRNRHSMEAMSARPTKRVSANGFE